jgi:predicted DNA-binding protein YlxM (UPF0122 family)
MENTYTYIYTISDNFGNIRYIGKSNNPRRRLYQHLNEKSNIHKYNWLRSIIKNNYFPKIEVLDEVPINEWEYWEMFYIEQFKQWGFKLLNATIGGDGASGYKHSNSSRKKMKDSKLGIKLSENHRNKISDSIKSKAKENPLYNRGVGNSKIFLNKDELYKKYIIENLSMPKVAKFFKVSKKLIFTNLKFYNIEKPEEIWKTQMSKTRKSILQYDLNGDFIKEWISLGEVKSMGINPSNVANCCRGISKTCNGYIWRYKDGNVPINLELNSKKRKVKQYDLNGSFINKFDSIEDAAKHTNISNSMIQSCCSGKSKSGGGYLWVYSETNPNEIKKYRNKLFRKVLQFSIDGRFIDEYESISKASKKSGARCNCITSCCKGKFKTAGGFIWKYK